MLGKNVTEKSFLYCKFMFPAESMPRGHWVSASHKPENKEVGEASPSPSGSRGHHHSRPTACAAHPGTEVGAEGSRASPVHRAPARVTLPRPRTCTRSLERPGRLWVPAGGWQPLGYHALAGVIDGSSVFSVFINDTEVSKCACDTRNLTTCGDDKRRIPCS